MEDEARDLRVLRLSQPDALSPKSPASVRLSPSTKLRRRCARSEALLHGLRVTSVGFCYHFLTV